MKALVNRKYLLEKFHGKGGSTFARIPEIKKNTKKGSGLVKVCGTIDGFEIRKYQLMSMGQGQLFLPVKAQIRKAIGKGEGDFVHVILYPDNEPLEVPEELLLCLEDDPAALKFFKSLSESERKFYIEWVCGAKREQTKVERLAKTINRLGRGLKMYDKVVDNNL